MTQPITLDTAKAHLRVTDDAEDELIQGYIDAAQQHIEDYTGLVLEPRTVVEDFDSWSAVRIRSAPIRSITSVTYVDGDGTTQLLDASSYTLAGQRRPGRLSPAAGVRWPIIGSALGAISVTMAAGYQSPDDVPASVKHALLLLVGHFYTYREPVATTTKVIELPLSVETLLRRYRLRRV